MKRFIFFARVYVWSIVACPMSLFAQEADPAFPNYVVIGAFAYQQNAVQFTKEARQRKFPARFEMNPNRNLYYVYVLTTGDHEYAVAEALRLRKETKYFDTWVYSGGLGKSSVPNVAGGRYQDINPATGERMERVGSPEQKQNGTARASLSSTTTSQTVLPSKKGSESATPPRANNRSSSGDNVETTSAENHEQNADTPQDRAQNQLNGPSGTGKEQQNASVKSLQQPNNTTTTGDREYTSLQNQSAVHAASDQNPNKKQQSTSGTSTQQSNKAIATGDREDTSLLEQSGVDAASDRNDAKKQQSTSGKSIQQSNNAIAGDRKNIAIQNQGGVHAASDQNANKKQQSTSGTSIQQSNNTGATRDTGDPSLQKDGGLHSASEQGTGKKVASTPAASEQKYAALASNSERISQEGPGGTVKSTNASAKNTVNSNASTVPKKEGITTAPPSGQSTSGTSSEQVADKKRPGSPSRPIVQQSASANEKGDENGKSITPSKSSQLEDASLTDDQVEVIAPPVRSTTKQLTSEEVADKKFYFHLFRADNTETIPGEVDAIDFDKSRKMGTYPANEGVKVMMAGGKLKHVSFVCQVFGYRKMQREFEPTSPAEDFYLDDQSNLVIPFELVRLQKGDIAIMYNVFFFKDAAVMRPESRYEVNNLLDLLVENPSYKIVIHGHTNGNASGKIIRMDKPGNFYSLTGTSQGFGSAKQLSEERAIVIRKFLISSGINEDRMQVRAWGGKKPIHDKHSVRAQENVRVEIEILSQ